MKNIVLGLSFVAAALLTTGCGGDGDKSVNLNDVTVKYKTAGTYDLSQYIVPNAAQTSNYVEESFTNNKGKKEYKQVADETTYTATRFDINGSTIKEYDKANELDVTDIILADKINIIIDSEDTTSIARFADNGDYVAKTTDNQGNSHHTLVCKVTKKLATKSVNGQEYSDVLEMSCTYKGDGSTMVNSQQLTSTTDGTILNYFAKDTGLISLVDESCTKTKLKDKVITHECTKETQSITTIN